MNIIENFEYRPSDTEKYNKPGSEFNIVLRNEDLTTQPSKSLLLIQGELKAKIKVTAGSPAVTTITDSPTIDLDLVHFVNNGILNLFDRIDYSIGDTKIDTIRNPGISTLMKELVSFERDLQYNAAGWKINSPSHKNILNENCHFTVTIPLSIMMGFFEDHTNFLYQVSQKLTFYRSNIENTNNVLYIEPDSGYTCTLTMSDVVWSVPQVKFSLKYETEIRKEILSGTNYSLEYRNWFYQSITPPLRTNYTWDFPVAYSKCKYIILAFQTA